MENNELERARANQEIDDPELDREFLDFEPDVSSITELLQELGVAGTVTFDEDRIYVDGRFLMYRDDLPSPPTADTVKEELRFRAKERGLLPQ